jgi:hypothetical protein
MQFPRPYLTLKLYLQFVGFLGHLIPGIVHENDMGIQYSYQFDETFEKWGYVPLFKT